MAFKTTQLIGLITMSVASLLLSTPPVASQGNPIGTQYIGTIAMHYGYDCKGNFVGCQNRPSAWCCSIDQQFSPGPNSFTVWSHTGGYLYADGRATGYRAFADSSCLGRIHHSGPGTCIQGDGPYFSGRWYEKAARIGVSAAEIEVETNITTSILESRDESTENCATADIYGFVEGDKLVTFPIPQGSEEVKAALYELLAQETTDGDALRKFAEVNKATAV